MSIWTSAELDEQISTWKAALLAVASGQSFTHPSGRQLNKADLPEIRKTLTFLGAEKDRLSGDIRRVQAKPVSDTW